METLGILISVSIGPSKNHTVISSLVETIAKSKPSVLSVFPPITEYLLYIWTFGSL